MWRVLVVVALSAVTLTAQIQPQRDAGAGQLQAPRDGEGARAGDGSIRGRVLAADTGEPLRKARVTLAPAGSHAPFVFTDGEGRYAFANLTAGRYTVAAHKAGFANAAFGARRLTSSPIQIEVADGATVDAIDIRLSRAGAISGRIVDNFGDPIEQATVTAQQLVRTHGRFSTTTFATAITDDLGEYRLGGLPAGSFYVSARLAAGQMIGGVTDAAGMPRFGITAVQTVGGPASRASAYYPGVIGLPRATPIAVREGEERSSIEFMVVPTRLATLSIDFVDAKGSRAEALASLVNVDPPFPGAFVRTIPFQGHTVATSLEAGEWTIHARGPQGVGVARVTMGSGDASVTVMLKKGAQVTGRVVLDGTPAPSTDGIQIRAFPLDASVTALMPTVPLTTARTDGTFQLTQVIGPVEIRAIAPPGWSEKAILHDGQDLLDSPIDFTGNEALSDVQVVLTNRLSGLSGTVIDADKRPVGDYGVLIFPEDRILLRSPRRVARWVRPNQQGRFFVDDLLPGSYLAIALDQVDEAEVWNADYLDRFRSRATRVTLGDREKKTIALERADVR
jgi:hypothetical protein